MSQREVDAAVFAVERAPNDVGRTANDFGVLKFDCDTAFGANALPAAFSGRAVRMTADGGDVHFAFSKSSTAEVDASVAATAAGASGKVGGIMLDGTSRRVQLPKWNTATETVYFVRDASADNTVVYMELSDLVEP